MTTTETPDATRIRYARDALVRIGYFTADEVSDDLAPRIHELVTAIRDVKFLPWHTHPANERCPAKCPSHGVDDVTVLERMAELVRARRDLWDAQWHAVRAEEDLSIATCSTCKGRFRVPLAPGQHAVDDKEGQPCPDCPAADR